MNLWNWLECGCVMQVGGGGGGGGRAHVSYASAGVGVAMDLPGPYSKQFVHSKSSQYKKMKQEWRHNVYLARSKIQGLGLYAARDIEKHTMVIEYIGEMIRSELAECREKRYDAQNRGIYMFRLDEQRVIDATLTGGLARYINHCCNPNCVAEAVEVERDLRIIIFANRRISRGEEVLHPFFIWLIDFFCRFISFSFFWFSCLLAPVQFHRITRYLISWLIDWLINWLICCIRQQRAASSWLRACVTWSRLVWLSGISHRVDSQLIWSSLVQSPLVFDCGRFINEFQDLLKHASTLLSLSLSLSGWSFLLGNSASLHSDSVRGPDPLAFCCCFGSTQVLMSEIRSL